MPPDAAKDRAMLKNMVHRSRRRLVSVSAGQPLHDVLQESPPKPPPCTPHPTPNKATLLTPQRNYVASVPLEPISMSEHYQQLVATESLRGDKHIPRRRAMRDKELGDVRKLQHIVKKNSHRRNAGVATSIAQAHEPERVGPIEPVRADQRGVRPVKKIFQKAVHKIMAQPEHQHAAHHAHSIHLDPHKWFEALRESVEAPTATALQPALAHTKMEPMTYGATIFLQSMSTHTCLLLEDVHGKSIRNRTAPDDPRPGSCFRLVDFTNPTRTGAIHDGDTIWLQLVGPQKPLHPSTNDVLEDYVTERQFYLARSTAPELDYSGPTPELLVLASLLEVSVPRLSHYGYDASLGDHLRSLPPPMQLAQWHIQLSPSALLRDDPLEDDALRPSVHAGGCLRNFAIVHLTLASEHLGLEVNSASERAVLAPPRAERNLAEWRLCLSERGPSPPLQKASSTSSLTKAHMSLHKSRARADTFSQQQSQLAHARHHLHETSCNHLALVDKAKEDSAATYFIQRLHQETLSP
ncbi:hypothetical protein SDRG_01935 [Saprolegnia diclina VS20]|uniref:Uncharacterized protein n=1 Tax=Saprolegnia diclina (strain VS20) TaxID=1156394 RepID=T0QRV2_SAPDV|nr:hypothetical protein SDRG_01935 [Saprolegnia diclina VS20]EQC40869.1 hypothetical protein SDRG_01935 [Saprolegnia diclina VS20]|eukprot:XP_008605713.1 hypothetical protein SDRG_01935 [Saprolegnia diclina VS20]